MDAHLKVYLNLASKCEDLKSEERILSSQINNIKNVRELLLQKERDFCEEDSKTRANNKKSMSIRCRNLIDHLVHYKCIIECLATDLLNLDTKILGDDEYLQLSLTYRQVELNLLQSIKFNQHRDEALNNLKEDEVQSYLGEMEGKWCEEHRERRKSLIKSIMDHHQFVLDKMKKNLAQQQLLLNHRYQFLNNLIEISYNSQGSAQGPRFS